MICGSCHGRGYLLRRWRKGPRPVCGGCGGRGSIPGAKVSPVAPKHFAIVPMAVTEDMKIPLDNAPDSK